MRHTLELIGTSVVGFILLAGTSAFAQTVTNPITSNSTSNPVSNLDQSGALINTQINTNQLGRSIVGNGIADCTTSGISASAFGSGVGAFESGTYGGAVTYTHSFGMKTCKQYAKTQLGKLQLETCLLLISNYSKMIKAGILVDYQELMSISQLECPTVQLAGIPTPSGNNQSNNRTPTSASIDEQDTSDFQITEPETESSSKVPARVLPYDSRRDASYGNYAPQTPAIELNLVK